MKPPASPRDDGGWIFRLPLGVLGWAGGTAMTMLLWSSDHERYHAYAGLALFCYAMACACTFPSTAFLSLRVVALCIVGVTLWLMVHMAIEFAQGRADEPPIGPFAFAGFLLWVFVPTLIYGSFDRIGFRRIEAAPKPALPPPDPPAPRRRDAWGLGLTMLFSAAAYAGRAWLGDPQLAKELPREAAYALAATCAVIGLFALAVSCRQSFTGGAHALVKGLLVLALALIVFFCSVIMLNVAWSVVAR